MDIQSKKFALPTGATLAVTVAPFADAWALTRAVLSAMKGTNVPVSELEREFRSITAALLSVPAVLDKILSLATSDEAQASMFKCGQRALYIPKGSPLEFPGIRVDSGLFDDPQHGEAAREDYAMIMVRLMEVNCKPFLARALSGLIAPAAVQSGGPQ